MHTSENNIPEIEMVEAPPETSRPICDEVDVGQMGYKKQHFDDKGDEYSFKSSSQFFINYSFRHVSRRKFHFLLSFCSIIIVVWSSLVINTLIEKGPIIFLK